MKLTKDTLEEYINSKNNISILFDADWNRKKITIPDGIEVGEIDVDKEELWDFCEKCGVVNIPAVTYFVNGKRIRTIIGFHDISKNNFKV